MKNQKITTIRHSLSHIMALAVQELFGKTEPIKFGIGPAIENGFYYDFELKKSIGLDDLPKIERKMKELIKQNLKFQKKTISLAQAKKILKNQPYKLDLLKDLKGKQVTIYQVGNFIDLCQGPHIASTKAIDLESFKLIKVAGAYWKGDEKNPMLQRIYGVAFQNKKELNQYIKNQKEVEKRDHRILGKKLELFIFDEEVGAGLPLWLPKGTLLRQIISDYLYEQLNQQNYQWVTTPHIGNLKLWQTSGHWMLYRENMYSPIKIEREKYLLKPMNCPFHVKIYQSKIRSYKDLPLRFAELGTVYRYEKSGVLHGLTRARGFTQDDAHIWCMPNQLNQVINQLLKHGLKILKTFGFKNFNIYLSTRPEKYAGTLQAWKKATTVLKNALKKQNLKYQIDPGGGVFYGPKIDIKIQDALGREWQCTTIQIDFNLPKRFKITYIDKNGKKREPIMIHRALIGSLERFIGVLLEHYNGALPLWLSPIQIWVIPISNKYLSYAESISQALKTANIRLEIKNENETLSKKIRQGEILKIPYLLIVGEKEIKLRKVRVRKRNKGDIGQMAINIFKEKIEKEINSKKC